ncbi:MAG TPA: FG-GAP-like repeat-containing protein [Candidatus Hydrogenedentes bacterium]|nr:FG-GAP-like repeat-containing protein [Candidatus Hydrogenedentota bacterium]
MRNGWSGWVLACAVGMAYAGMAAAELEQVWSWQPAGEQFDASVGVGDLNGDGRPELVCGGIHGSVTALDYAGNPVWTWTQMETVSAAPAVADVHPSPGPEVLVLTNMGVVYALAGGDGRELWQYRMSGHIRWACGGVAAADLDGDGNLELVVSDSALRAVALRGDGTERWRFDQEGGFLGAPTVADLDGDGRLEVLLAGARDTLICLDADGREKFRAGSGVPAGGAQVAADLDGDGHPEILCGTADGLRVFTATGEDAWSVPLDRGVDSAISVADIDGDGQVEVIAGDLSGKLSALTRDGRVLWQYDLGERIRRSASIADLTGDGKLEIIAAGYDKTLSVLDASGHLLASVGLGGATNATPAVVDLRGDGLLSVVCPVVTGAITVWRWRNAAPGRVAWAEYRMDSSRRGWIASVSGEQRLSRPVITLDPGKLQVGRNECGVTVTFPEVVAAEVALEVCQDGRPTRKTFESEGLFASGVMAYTLGARWPVELVFSCVVTDRQGNELARVTRQARFEPFTSELATLVETLDALDQLSRVLPPTEAVPYATRAAWLRERLPDWQRKAAAREALSGETLAAFTRELQGGLDASVRLKVCGEWLKNNNRRLLAVSANPWAPFGGVDELVEGRTGLQDPAVEAFCGEVESAAFNLFNLGDAPLYVRLENPVLTGPDGKERPAGDVVIPREAVPVPTEMGDVSADALPGLNQGNVVVIPPRDGRQVYLEIDTKGLEPGAWTVSILCRALDRDAADTTLTVPLTVWNHRLPEHQTIGLCHWGYEHSSYLKDQPEAALEDQLRHGTSVFVSTFAPRATFDEKGELAGEPDYAEVDAYMDARRGRGIILFCGYQGALSGPAPARSETWNRAHVAWLRAWVEHMKSRGFTYEEWALYPVDEPGLHPGLVELFIDMARLAREADPNIRIYTDPVGDASLEDLRAMAPYVDIWCPNRTGIVLKPDSTKLEFIKSTGSDVFVYECLGNAKHRSALAYYRGQAWLCAHHGFKAMGFWTYCTTRFDPWFNNGEPDYLLVYQGRGVVPSKRWHAVRDGIEDHGMLTRLREAMEKAGEDPARADVVARARDLLTRRVAEVARFCGLEDDGDTPEVGGTRRQRAVEDRRWQTLREIRRDIATLLDALAVP